MTDARNIMQEERDKTLAEIERLPLSLQSREDVLLICGAIQIAINDTIERLDRAVDPRVAPHALRIMAAEIERTSERFIAAGLATRLQ
jgi:ACT domain-containing protein